MKTHCLAIALFGSVFASLAAAQTADGVPTPFEKAPDPDGGTFAENPSDGAMKSLQVQLEYIELSHEALTSLMFLAEPKTSDAASLRKRLQEMVENNEARILETLIAVGESDGKLTSESVSEFIYPTEYEPPSMPCGGDPKDPSSFGNSITPMMPTAFDTRNIGSSLEAEPIASVDGNTVKIRLATELTWHTGNTTWLEDKDTIGNNHQAQMPNFYSLRLKTSVTCVKSQYTLVAVQSPKDDKGEVDMTRKVVMLVKCDVLAVK
jgi:hypothetical protein